MANQMTPAELRAATDRAAGILTPGTEVRADDLRVVITAARRLADVIEYAEPFAGKQFAGFAAMWDAHPQMVEVVRIAGGETTNENRSE